MTKHIQENHSTELKRSLTEQLDKTMVAFLNTHEGEILLGVKDNGDIVGLEDIDQKLKRISEIIKDRIAPSAIEFIHPRVEEIRGLFIIRIQVAKGLKQLYYLRKYGQSPEGVFVRKGTTNRSLTHEEIQRRYELDYAPKLSIVDVEANHQKMSFSMLKNYLVERGYHINDESFYTNYSLVNKQGKLNLLASLLCDEANISIKVVRFNGTQKADGIIDRSEFGYQCLLWAMQKAEGYVETLNLGSSTIQDLGPRKDINLFDKESFKQAWYNACLHNQWIDQPSPAIYVYTNHIEIVSNGTLRSDLSIDEFYRGVSKPVNRELSDIFIKLGLIEQSGFGIPRILKIYDKSVFELLDHTLIVSLPFRYEVKRRRKTNKNLVQIFDESQNEPQKIGDLRFDTQNDTQKVRDLRFDTQNDTQKRNLVEEDLTELKKRLLKLLKDDNKLSKFELSQMIRISKATVTRALRQMPNVYWVGSSKGGHWHIEE